MKDQLKMILFVVILGVVASAILLGSDTYTKEIIKDNQDYSLKASILNAFGIGQMDDVVATYDQNISEKTIGDSLFYFSEDGGVGFEVSGKGLWGPIEGFLVLEPDLKTIRGIQILYNEETPGLGGVVAEQWYLDKYKGKIFDPTVLIKKEADPSATNEIDSITGATLTSTFFQKLLNENYEARKGLLVQ